MPHDSARLIQYKVRTDTLGEQEAAVREWIEAIKDMNDPDVGYTVFVAEGGQDFVHLVTAKDEDAIARIQTLPLFKAFSEGIGARSESGPAVTKLSLLASSLD